MPEFEPRHFSKEDSKKLLTDFGGFSPAEVEQLWVRFESNRDLFNDLLEIEDVFVQNPDGAKTLMERFREKIQALDEIK